MQETYTPTLLQTLPPTQNLKEIQNLELKISRCEFIANWNEEMKKMKKIDQSEFENRQILNQIALATFTKKLSELEVELLKVKLLSELKVELGISKNILEKS